MDGFTQVSVDCPQAFMGGFTQVPVNYPSGVLPHSPFANAKIAAISGNIIVA